MTEPSMFYDRVARLATYGFGSQRDQRLAVCHRCEKIGPVNQALAHERSTGHEIEVLDPCVSDAVRAEWQRLASSYEPDD